MTITKYKALAAIELLMMTNYEFMCWFVDFEMVKLAEAGNIITVSTEQTSSKKNEDDGIDILWADGTATRHDFATLGRLIASGALQQITEEL